MFFGMGGDGLAAYFTPDDMMNLFGAWFRPLLEQGRPLGALVYRVVFAGFGLNPLPYRIVCFLLLAGNLVLLYAVAARLSASRTAGALACLLGAYHAHLADLYYSTDTIYELLCFAFYWGAVLAWTRQRRWLAFGLCAGALLSKEMAVTLPVILAAYELLYRGRAELRRLLPFALLTALFIARALAGRAHFGDFIPHFTWRVMAENWGNFGTDLFYGAFPLTPVRVLLLWAAVAALAALLRTRDAALAVVVIWVGMLPVVFIAPRGFYVAYLTLPGWYLLLARALERATRRVNPALVFAALAIALVPLHAARKEKGRWWVADAHASVRALIDPLRNETLLRGGRVLLVADPYPKDDYLPAFIFWLRYRDETIRVVRLPALPESLEGYDRVYRCTGDRPQNWRFARIDTPRRAP